MDTAPDVDPEVRAYVEQAVAALLRPDEVDRWELRWEWDPDDGLWQLVTELWACGEWFKGFVMPEGFDLPIAHGLDNFTDGLEDFISESRFAWGQQRELRDRPWHGR